jgi:hypothetical protein
MDGAENALCSVVSVVTNPLHGILTAERCAVSGYEDAACSDYSDKAAAKWG